MSTAISLDCIGLRFILEAMRLKEQTSNWNAGGIQRRDYRHTSVDGVTKHKAKKNTKRWCRGKVGVEHEFENIIPQNMRTFAYMKMDVCKNCKYHSSKNMKFHCKQCGWYPVGEWHLGKHDHDRTH